MALTEDGRPICGGCGAIPKARWTTVPFGADPRMDGWGLRPWTLAEYSLTARAGGWRVGQLPSGEHDAMCRRCAKPDPVLVRLCKELAR